MKVYLILEHHHEHETSRRNLAVTELGKRGFVIGSEICFYGQSFNGMLGIEDPLYKIWGTFARTYLGAQEHCLGSIQHAKDVFKALFDARHDAGKNFKIEVRSDGDEPLDITDAVYDLLLDLLVKAQKSITAGSTEAYRVFCDANFERILSMVKAYIKGDAFIATSVAGITGPLISLDRDLYAGYLGLSEETRVAFKYKACNEMRDLAMAYHLGQIVSRAQDLGDTDVAMIVGAGHAKDPLFIANVMMQATTSGIVCSMFPSYSELFSAIDVVEGASYALTIAEEYGKEPEDEFEALLMGTSLS